MTYIDALQPRKGNFYADFGILVHNCFEQYFSGALEAFELSDYYNENYTKVITNLPPAANPGLGEKYKAQGENFFNNFSFDIENYDILLTEDKIDFSLDTNILFTARPDLVLKSKRSGEVTLYDYKTSTPYWTNRTSGIEVADKEKLSGYYKQMYLYAYSLRVVKKIAINNIALWFPRLNKITFSKWEEEEEKNTILSMKETVKQIHEETEFPYNNTNSYFCRELCSMRDFCEFRS
jgi:hypothetical protein